MLGIFFRKLHDELSLKKRRVFASQNETLRVQMRCVNKPDNSSTLNFKSSPTRWVFAWSFRTSLENFSLLPVYADRGGVEIFHFFGKWLISDVCWFFTRAAIKIVETKIHVRGRKQSFEELALYKPRASYSLCSRWQNRDVVNSDNRVYLSFVWFPSQLFLWILAELIYEGKLLIRVWGTRC